jgi:hypothetical protein
MDSENKQCIVGWSIILFMLFESYYLGGWNTFFIALTFFTVIMLLGIVTGIG